MAIIIIYLFIFIFFGTFYCDSMSNTEYAKPV